MYTYIFYLVSNIPTIIVFLLPLSYWPWRYSNELGNVVIHRTIGYTELFAEEKIDTSHLPFKAMQIHSVF
jgi:hypothetical protein